MKTYFIAVVGPSTIEFLQYLRRILHFILKQLIPINLLLDLRRGKIPQNPLQHIEPNPRLHIISPIQTIQTIGPDNASLPGYQFLQLSIEDSDPKAADNFLYFFDQSFTIFELVIFALLVEIEVLVPDVLGGVEVGEGLEE